MAKHCISKFKGLFSLILPLILLTQSSSAWAKPPNLWWNHLYHLDLTQASCVAKAQNLLQSNSTGKIKTSEDGVQSRDQKTIAVVECLPSGQDILVMVLVSSKEVESGDSLFNTLMKGMAE